MAPESVIDSHIHLWPASAANSEGHGWMEEGGPLTKQHILQDYNRATKQDVETKVQGVVYVETDRRLQDGDDQDFATWVSQPIKEVEFLRSVVEGQYGQQDSDLLCGIVLWAPVNRGLNVFEDWLQLVEKTAGQETWRRVKGFRFLLQAITNQSEFEKLVFSDGFISTVRSFSEKGRQFSFDVGIDQHSGGVWQLEAFVKVMDRLYRDLEADRSVTLVMNHLCKPDLTIGAEQAKTSDDFHRWCACIKRFASFPKVYMKLSGSFSELSTGRLDTTSPEEIADRMKPWLDCVFDSFGPDRIMFGSDWPVCNVRGPAVEDSWSVWRKVVSTVIEQRALSVSDEQKIWSGTATKVYRLGLNASS